MAANKTLKYFTGIAVAAIVPLSLFFVARHFSDGKIKMPAYYRPDSVQQIQVNGKMANDTFFHRAKGITLTNQLGQKVDLNTDLKGKILVVDFMFTTCKSVCPNLSANMKDLQQAYSKKNPDLVQFISISVDPARDSVPVLRAYADRYTAEHDRWWFLTGNKDSIFDYAKNELGLLLTEADVSGDVVHSGKMVLLDTARNIRGYFDGTDKAQTKLIADDIYILSVEKRKKGR
ncbi:MAG: SCO family protein [Edaphocola sp.]